MKRQVALMALMVSALCGGCRMFELDDDLAFYESFDSLERLAQPELGPKGHFDRCQLEDGKSGKAFLVTAGCVSLSYPFPAGFIGDRGCIEFWAKILRPTSKYRNCDPCFFHQRFDNGEETVLGFSANNGMGRGGLCGRVVHYERETERMYSWEKSYAPVLGEDGIGDWHHYAIVWNTQGIRGYARKDGKPSVAVMMLDGQVVADESFAGHRDDVLDSFRGTVANLSTLYFPRYQASGGRDFLIDEFKIWKVDKMDF